MTKEVIEIRDAAPHIDEQIARMQCQNIIVGISSWEKLIETSDEIKAVARCGDVPTACKYRYPMYDEIKIEIRKPLSIDLSIIEAIGTRIELQMLRRNQSDAVLICETKDRVPKSKRKDKARTAPKTTAKLIIPTLNDIEAAVNNIAQRINSLISRIPVDGILIRFRLGTINTLEFISSQGEDDEFHGF